jgi:hypothetical protein
LIMLALSVLTVTMACPLLRAQPDTLWTRTYGGRDFERGHAIVRTQDGGYIIGGYTTSFGAGGRDVYLVRTDSDGDTIWTRTYGGSDSDVANAVVNTSDGGFLAVGYTYSYGLGGRNAYLVRTDPHGDTLWTKTYGGNDLDDGRAVVRTPDDGFAIVGGSYSYGPGPAAVWMLRIDSDGDTLWMKTYGGTDIDFGESVVATPDNGFFIVGRTYSYGVGSADVYLIRTDAQGNIIWTRAYGGGGWDSGFSVAETSEGSYIVTGATESFGAIYENVYLLSVDPDGDTLWTRMYGGNHDDRGNAIVETYDRGYLITGWTYSFGEGECSVYLIRTDRNGATLWTTTYGGNKEDFGSSVTITADGGYIVAGYSLSFGAGESDIYVVRIAQEVGVEEENGVDAPIIYGKVWPNPSSGDCWVAYGMAREGNVRITLYDLVGRVVCHAYGGYERPGQHIVRLDTSSFSSGIYFLRLETPDRLHTMRMVSVRGLTP